MRKSTGKLMLFVILPVLVLIMVGGICLLKIKPIRYAVVSYMLRYSFNKAVEEGRLTKEGANKLQYEIQELVKTAEEADLTKEESDWFAQEVLKYIEPLEKLENEEKLTDEDVQKLLDVFKEMRLKIIEIVQKRGQG